MRKDITVSAAPRTARGKNEARRLRVQRLSPAILYGAGKEPLAVSVSPRELTRILHSASGHNTIFNLAIKDGETVPVMIVDAQLDPVKGHLLHADLERIDLSKRLKVKVEVRTKGDPKGVKQQGGLLELVAREVEIECLPDEIPEHLTVDVTELLIGQALRAAAVPLSGSMKLVSNPDAVIAHVIALRAAVEAAPAEAAAAPAAAAAEPEVIKKGKKEEEEAAGEEKKKK